MDRMRLEFCAEVFLSKMRQQYVVQNPGKPSTIKTLKDYSPEHRAALMSAIQTAIGSADPKADLMFTEWLSKRPAGSQ